MGHMSYVERPTARNALTITTQHPVTEQESQTMTINH